MSALWTSAGAESRVSEELSEVLAAIIESSDAEMVTLGEARELLRGRLDGEGKLPGGAGEEESVYPELEALVEEFGAEAPAADFIAARTSEALSELIEALLDQTGESEGLTLGEVREAIELGLAARLEGGGVLEVEDEQALLAELDRLIERHGPDALAEELLRFD